LEQQITRLKSESQTLTENLNIQTEKAQRLTIELEESERSRRVNNFSEQTELKSSGIESRTGRSESKIASDKGAI